MKLSFSVFLWIRFISTSVSEFQTQEEHWLLHPADLHALNPDHHPVLGILLDQLRRFSCPCGFRWDIWLSWCLLTNPPCMRWDVCCNCGDHSALYLYSVYSGISYGGSLDFWYSFYRLFSVCLSLQLSNTSVTDFCQNIFLYQHHCWAWNNIHMHHYNVSKDYKVGIRISCKCKILQVKFSHEWFI